MLLGPSYIKKQAIRWWMPYALDNDAYSAFEKRKQWEAGPWREMLIHARMTGIKPLWVLVPDVVADKQATLDSWDLYSDEVKEFGWPLAFAVQDGMVPSDVPKEADLIFVGGTTQWKWRSLPMWTQNFNRVHVGRVNALHRLWICEDHGVESVDGTGWFRDTTNGKRAGYLLQWLEGTRNETKELKIGV